MMEPMLTLCRMRIHLQRGKEIGLLPVLFLTRNSLASDARDFLFANYGLLGETATALCAPDYNISSEVMCREFVGAYIEDRKDLSIVCHAGISFSDRKTSLPSWLPD